VPDFVLGYEQTPSERYDIDTNERVRSFLAQSVTIDGESGGYDFTTDVCDQEFYFSTDRFHADALRDIVADMLSRKVTLDVRDDVL
jgi:hypothetical protein